ncbi:hypothetical protein [Flavivirga eckloniae]|uniref:Outer membrane protein beta-barrel domain-containing protein n=1 Tax=Flavivirga eckloniae TaxID=1803846 RepID=A0A2K9PVC0_9FLAO|nr:hypothetical protein [Flavivirga eckloniae]AUP81013.1 hypothetical protein C1H87_20765 [Flavivirga eckloniae]
MKKITVVFFTLLLTSTALSQQKVFKKYNPNETQKTVKTDSVPTPLGPLSVNNTSKALTQLEQDEKEFGSLSENISFGLSLGFNNALENLKVAQISPIDNTLLISNAQKTSFVLSTAVSVPISYNKRRAYRITDKDGAEIGQVHRISEWSIIGVVNLVTLKGAESGDVFNQKISGGLGISYSFSRDFSLGLSYELISYRKPKDFLLNLEGQEIQVNGETVNAIEISDNNYYYDRYAGTLAFKIIYKLTKT